MVIGRCSLKKVSASIKGRCHHVFTYEARNADFIAAIIGTDVIIGKDQSKSSKWTLSNSDQKEKRERFICD